MSPAPLRQALRVLTVLLILVALGFQTMANRTHRHALALLQAENQLLQQELRLLEQQLEAERILAAAHARSPDPATPASAASTSGPGTAALP